jgi:uncharacterized protein YbjQ (UPF0145 family)
MEDNAKLEEAKKAAIDELKRKAEEIKARRK